MHISKLPTVFASRTFTALAASVLVVAATTGCDSEDAEGALDAEYEDYEFDADDLEEEEIDTDEEDQGDGEGLEGDEAPQGADHLTASTDPMAANSNRIYPDVLTFCLHEHAWGGGEAFACTFPDMNPRVDVPLLPAGQNDEASSFSICNGYGNDWELLVGLYKHGNYQDSKVMDWIVVPAYSCVVDDIVGVANDMVSSYQLATWSVGEVVPADSSVTSSGDFGSLSSAHKKQDVKFCVHDGFGKGARNCKAFGWKVFSISRPSLGSMNDKASSYSVCNDHGSAQRVTVKLYKDESYGTRVVKRIVEAPAKACTLVDISDIANNEVRSFSISREKVE